MLLEERRRTLQEYDSCQRSINSTGDASKAQQYQRSLHIIRSRHTNQNEHLMKHISQRNERISLLLVKSFALMLRLQHDYFTSVAGLYADMSTVIGPLAAEYEKVQPGISLDDMSSRQQQRSSQPAQAPPVHNSTPPQNQNQPQPQPQQQPQSRPQQTENINVHSSQTAMAKEQIFSKSTDDFFASSPTASSPVSQNVNGGAAASMFDFDLNEEDAMKTTGEKPMAPASAHSADPFFGFGGGAAPAKKGPNVFDELDSLGSSPSSPSAAPQRKPTPATSNQPSPQPQAHRPAPSDPFDDLFGGAQQPSSASSATNSPNPFTVNTSSPDPSFGSEPKVDMLAAMRLRDLEKEQEHEQRRNMDDGITKRVEVWAGGRRGNLRALLSTLHTLLPEGSGWKEVSLGDLLMPSRVKVSYRKALLVVHPDKSQGKSLEEKLIAERAFELLNEAYKKEEAMFS
eukprot:TRINITY_DN4786_c0_g1_i2.p1 TRINITY_DN4786_c0_g1~~TRINITY_DN4786_c0_g1_i2.p1  ORF type:complete len:456 (+),score=132.38 TRINITY_DN4786_c0_g1_i2:1020-2387(+)